MKAKGVKKKITSKPEVVSLSRVPANSGLPVSVGDAFASCNSFPVDGNPRNPRDILTMQFGNRFKNLREGITPYEDNGGYIGVTEAIYLCQRAYWNVPIFKQTIDIMAEFSNVPIHWEGGNKTSRTFFQALWKKVNGWHVQDQFFRDYYRSGNIFFLRFDGQLSAQDVKRITQVYPDGAAGAASIPLPVAYMLLNPMDMRLAANISFYATDPVYYKVLNIYELARLKNPQTDQEIALFKSLTPQQQKDIKLGIAPLIPVDASKLHPVFYKKMDYEPMAVPMGFCVLDDIDLKLELKKMDRVILKTVESTILLVTVGAEPDKGGINEKALGALQQIFQTETVGRVLVADYTTKLDFVIPDLNKVLGPTKYEVINEDIANGLSNIFWGEQKFANAMIKIKIFIERLKDGQNAFLEQFLTPEVQRISKIMGFKSYPIPKFKDINLDDDIQASKMITRLAEIGVLTADETIEAIKTGVLPTPEASVDDQTEYFQHRQNGLYTPLLGPTPMTFNQQQDQIALKKQGMVSPKPMSGRPGGTKAPQSTKNVKPIGTGEKKFSLSKLKDIVIESDKVIKGVEAAVKKQHKLKKLNDQQTEAAFAVAQTILENEPVENWETSVAAYLKTEQTPNHEACDAIEQIAYDHQISRFVAILLYHSGK